MADGEPLVSYGRERGALKHRSKGLSLVCYAWSPKSGQAPHSVLRTDCLLMPYEYCPRCENSQFVVRLKVLPGVNDQQVSCPRWEKDLVHSYHLHRDIYPREYVQIRREMCFKNMFWFCKSCPNSNRENEPISHPGWYNEWVKRHKKGKK